jgi:enediyne biosynthesis protein E4
MEMERQIPFLRKKFLYAADFAKASLSDILPSDKLDHSELLYADEFSNSILINKGSLKFELQPLPWNAQLTSYRDAVVVDANDDKLPDVFLAGNYYENNIEMGRYDADLGTLLINTGKSNFTAEQIRGVTLKGQLRRIKNITVAGRPAFLLANNNDTLRVIGFRR